MTRRLLPLLVALALAGCSRCTPGSRAAQSDASRYLVREATASVLIQKPGELGQKLTLLQRLHVANLAAATQGAPSGEDYVTSVLGQVGIDLRDKASIERAGVDPDRPLGLSFLLGGAAYAVVPVKDLGRLRETLKTLAANRLGAPHLRKDGEVEVFAADAAAPGQLGFVQRGEVALIAAPPLLAELGSYANLSAERALLGDPVFKAAVARLPRSADAYLFTPSASQVSAEVPPQVTVAFELSEEALVATVDLPRARGSAGHKALTRADGPDLRGRLPQDAFLTARFQGDPSDLALIWDRLLGEDLRRAARETGVDLEKDLLGNLRPGAVLALALAQSAPLGGGVPAFDLRRTNPFQFVNLVAIAQVKDAKLARATLEKLPELAPRIGARVEATTRDGQPVYRTGYAAGEGIHFAPHGDHVVFAAPMERLLSVLASLEQPPAAPRSRVPALDDRAFAAVLDLPQLAESIRSLPSSAWGLGGFAIKATTLRWLEAIGDLRAVTLAAHSREEAIHLEVALRFEKKQ